MDIYHEKIYDNRMIAYMKTLTKRSTDRRKNTPIHYHLHDKQICNILR